MTTVAMPVLPKHRLHAKIKIVWRISGTLVALGLTGAAAVPLLALDISALAIIPIAISCSAIGLATANVQYARWRYEIRERDLFLSKGVVFHRLILVPLDRIQFVETKQGPLDRSFGLTQIVVHTAGGHVGIPGLEPREAERLREELAAVSGSLGV